MQLAFTFPRSSATSTGFGTPFDNPDMPNDPKRYSAIVETDAEAAGKLRNKALRLLTTREHSREELMRKLAQSKARRARDRKSVV